MKESIYNYISIVLFNQDLKESCKTVQVPSIPHLEPHRVPGEIYLCRCWTR